MAPLPAGPGRTSRWDPLTAALGGVLLQYVWRIQEVVPELAAVQFTAVVSLGTVVLYALDGHRGRRLTNLGTPLFRAILFILVLSAASVPFGLHVGASFGFLTGNFLKTVVLVGILAASIRDRSDVERLLRIFVFGALGYVVAAIAFSVEGRRLQGRGSYDPNDLGLFVVSTIPLCIYLMRRRARTMDRLLGAAAAAMLLVATVQSGSRGGFLGLVAAAGYGVLGFEAVRRSRRLAVTLAAATVLVIAAGDAYWERMSTILAPHQDYNWVGQAESGRMEVWKRGVGYMLGNPLFGVGVNQFNVAEGTLAPQSARQATGAGWKWSAAHSSYIQIGAELGVLGLAAFVALLGLAFLESRKIGRCATSRGDRLLGQAFATLFVGYAVGGAFLSQAYATYLYFAVGLLIGFSRVVVRQPATEPVVVPTSLPRAPTVQHSYAERGLLAARPVRGRAF